MSGGRLRPAARARSVTRRVRRRLSRHVPAQGLPPTEWVRAEPAPPEPEPLPFRFFAILGTWYEADVVGATVRNALAQGCEQVYLVDNESPDDTVARAVEAGATLARSFATASFDEPRRIALMDEVVDEVSAASDAGHVWWLWLDADEFHHGSGGRTLRQQLETLDRRYRVVGARFLNHYPDRVPGYVTGHHPLDDQPLAEDLAYPMCAARHRKHPLLRWDRDGPPVHGTDGFHQARSTGQLVEPTDAIYLHHFPFRDEDATRRRLMALCAPPADAGTSRAPLSMYTDHMNARFRSLDAVYRQDWRHVANFVPGQRKRGVRLRPWTELVPPEDRNPATWSAPAR